MVVLLGLLPGCMMSGASLSQDPAPLDNLSVVSAVRQADFSARAPVNDSRSDSANDAPRPMLFPSADVEPEPPRRGNNPDPSMRSASFQQASLQSQSSKGDGVEINFDGADVQTVAKYLLGDVLQLNFVVDPHVQGNVTLSSSGPISSQGRASSLRKRLADVQCRDRAFRKSREDRADYRGGRQRIGERQEPASPVSAYHWCRCGILRRRRYPRRLESFLSRPGSIRTLPSRNLLLVQGTTAERQATLDLVETFDVEWLRDQSVGVYPLKSTSPETMIARAREDIREQRGRRWDRA